MEQLPPVVVVKVRLFGSENHVCAMCGEPLPDLAPTIVELVDPPAPGMLYMPACPKCVASSARRVGR